MRGLLDFLAALALPAAGLYFLCIKPLKRIARAKTWQARTCFILSSAVEEDQNDSGLYRLVIHYQYQVAGRTYTSRRYSFSMASSPGGATAGYRGKKAIVDRLPPGASTVCWVDPDDPREAVIDRGLTWDIALVGVFFAACLAAFAFFAWHDFRLQLR